MIILSQPLPDIATNPTLRVMSPVTKPSFNDGDGRRFSPQRKDGPTVLLSRWRKSKLLLVPAQVKEKNRAEKTGLVGEEPRRPE
jgi:hypothetical protein